MATTYYVQSGATSDNCGGTDADDSLARSGTDGVSNSTTTFTSATAAFTAGDVGRGIWINTTTPRWRLIASVTNSTTVVLNSALTTTQSGLSWKIGGSWKTLAQLYSANGFVSGDTAYVAPGTYREIVTVAMTSATVTTSIIGDPANSKGFKNSSAVAISPGSVIHSAYTTNDTTTPSTSILLSLAGRDFLSFQNIIFMGGNNSGGASCVDASTNTSTDITFTDCVFVYGSPTTNNLAVNVTSAADIAINWTFSRCRFHAHKFGAVRFQPATSTVADYNLNVLISDCEFFSYSNHAVVLSPTGANSFKPGGLTIINCICYAAASFLNITTATASTSIPCLVYNNQIVGGFGTAALVAGASGQITEDYNYIYATTARTNVTAGTHSVVGPTYAFLTEVGQSYFEGRLPRPFGSPSAGSPFLNFGSAGSPPSVDILNRPKPAGAAGASNAIGAYERHDTGIAGGTANADAGNCLQLGPGPADHDFLIPVNAVATVISIKQKTSSYGGTNYPQMTLLANGELGVVTETITDSSAHTSYTILTFSPFTPTKAGWVTVRLQNRTNDGVGIVYWDTAVLPGVDLTGFDNYNRTEPFPALDTAGRPIMQPIEG